MRIFLPGDAFLRGANLAMFGHIIAGHHHDHDHDDVISLKLDGQSQRKIGWFDVIRGYLHHHK